MAVGTPPQRDLVLLVGTYRPALTAARALARAGRRVIVGHGEDLENIEGSAGVERSRAVDRVWRHPSPAVAPDAFVAALSDEVRRIGEPLFVLPFYEPVLVLLSRQRDALPAHARLVVPDADLVELCIDKARSLRAARDAGLRELPWQVVLDHAELVAAVESIGAVAVRPLNQTRIGHRNALLLDDVAALRKALPAWPDGHERLLVQQLARGPRIDVHFAARDGEILGSVEAIAPRMDRPDGTGLGVETVTRPATRALHEQLARFLAHIGYTGAGLAQFLLDPGGEDGWFLELNPRIGGNLALVDRAGLDLANMAVDLAAGRPIATPLPPTTAAGVRSVWLLGDLAGLRRAAGDSGLSRREQVAWLGRMLKGAARADVHAMWSWRDPLPALSTWWRYLGVAAGRRARRLAGARRGAG